MLFEMDPIDLHYMTDRQDLKISNLKIHLGCPRGKLKHTKN